MESNWDIDHDYTKESLAPLDCNLRLTPDEESLITELTSALSDVPVTNHGIESTNGITNSLENYNQTGNVTTPDIIKEFFDFGMDVNVADQTDNSLGITGNGIVDTDKSRVPSPISKEQILDFLEDKTNSSPKYGSESGYESILSPSRSLESSSPRPFESSSHRSIGSNSPRSVGSNSPRSFDSSSPRSFASEEASEDQGMELDSFIELFPSLF